jgi:hypothetical protein
LENDRESDPMPGIRLVLAAGFVSADAVGLLCLTIAGQLIQAAILNPLALAGAIAGVGFLGMMFGSIGGLSLRLLLAGRSAAGGWYAPIVLSALIGAAIGWFSAQFVMG